MSPRKAILRLQALVQKCGVEAVVKRNQFKQERELLAAAVLLMGISDANTQQYWMRPAEDISADIDVRSFRFDQSEGKSEIVWEDIQITEFESHSRELLAVIAQKIERTHDQGRLNLVINIREKEGDVFDPSQIKEAVKELNPDFRSIWLVVDDISDEWRYHLAMVWPHCQQHKFNMREVLPLVPGPDWVRLRRGTRSGFEGLPGSFDL